MNQKQAKKLRKLAKKVKVPYNLIKNNFKSLNVFEKKKIGNELKVIFKI